MAKKRRPTTSAPTAPPGSNAETDSSPAELRLLVMCPHCRRQFRANGWKSGAKFHCLCGEQVTIGRSRGHAAAVVRCSSCGAAREKAAPACQFCGADFTARELDLNTVCPACLARISHEARYCHHCGTAILAEHHGGAATSYRCPYCGPRIRLVSRRLPNEQVTVLECPRCVGVWLGLQSFGHLLEGEPRAGGKSAPTATPAQRGAASGYRPCVECRDLMVRRNFGRGRSGVVVDVCGRHGLWFDADELTQLMAWVRTGGLEAAKDDLALLQAAPDRVRRRSVTQRQQRKSAPSAPPALQPMSADEPADFWWVLRRSGDIVNYLMQQLQTSLGRGSENRSRRRS